MNRLLIQKLDKIYDDIVKDYVHDGNIDDDVSNILRMIDELQNEIKWVL